MLLLRTAFFITLFLFVGVAFAQRPPTNIAKIVYVGPASGSVGFVTSSGLNDINAQIGRWDTPYPYPSKGEYAPGLQPTGYSSLVIDVDVNDGGIASFRYMMQTYDAGIWDWYEILMETPDGTIPIVERLGKPGNTYGTFWASPTIAISQSLNKWRNKRVRFIFRVMQDGWGDQSQGQLIGFAVRTCDVAPLTQITDPASQNFENGNTIDTANLTPAAAMGLSCMRQAVSQYRGNFRVNSAYRPVAYQSHLREVWDTWMAIRNKTSTECDELRLAVQREFQQHQLLVSQRPAAGDPNAPHSRGIAFDATITNLPAEHTLDSIAVGCNMHRPWPGNDPVHYQPR